MKIDIQKLESMFVYCNVSKENDFYKEIEYIQIPSKVFIEKYLENSNCSEYTKKIVKYNSDYIRIYFRDNCEYRILIVRDYQNGEELFRHEDPLTLISDSLSVDYIDSEIDLVKLIKYFEELYLCYCDTVYNISEFIEDVCQFFRNDMNAASIKMYEDIEKCFIEED